MHPYSNKVVGRIQDTWVTRVICKVNTVYQTRVISTNQSPRILHRRRVDKDLEFFGVKREIQPGGESPLLIGYCGTDEAVMDCNDGCI